MVIFYTSKGEIDRVEHNVMSPTLPTNCTPQEKIDYYNEQGLRYVGVPYEPGVEIFDHKVITSKDGTFLGIVPKKESDE